jgi:hypothetical protein
MKLSPRQLDVLRKMADGWDVFQYGEYWLWHKHFWRSPDGESIISIDWRTVRSLDNHGMLESACKPGLKRWQLTDAGRAALAEAEGGER